MLTLRSLVTDLWCEVVLENAERLDLEFGDQWLLLVEAEARERRKIAGFVEQVQVVQGELLGYWLLNFNTCLIFFPVTLI